MIGIGNAIGELIFNKLALIAIIIFILGFVAGALIF